MFLFCCYPNQLSDGQIILPDDFSAGNMVILNMGALRKGNLEVIAGEESNLPENTNIPVLLSPGVIEYYESDNGKKYVQTVLRDDGNMNTSEGITSLANANERTTTAGRNFSGDLFEDLEIENAEESPFLMQDESGEYYLVSHDLKYKEYLILSIREFLENKYLDPEDENYKKVKTSFELKFKGIKYEELSSILWTIIEKDNFKSYSWEDGEIDGIKMQEIQLDNQVGQFYIFHDLPNNTIEYRAIRKILQFPKGLRSVGRIPLRLFLESQNQDPSFKNIRNILKYGSSETKLVPAINDFAKRVSGIIKSGKV